MCKILIIEDQLDTIEKYKALAEGTGVTFLAPTEVGLTELQPVEGQSIEEQLATHLKDLIARQEIDLVLLDTDLSRGRVLQTHSSYKAALRELGMPVCRYQKGGTESPLAQLTQLQRTIRDGASAIWIPKALVSGDRLAELAPRLIAISQGFKAIFRVLNEQPDLLNELHSPTDVLAAVLRDENLSYEFLGYAAQNLVYFARPEGDIEAYQISKVQRYATQLGYWLFNYIITFPGPILSEAAAAAYLNVHPDELSRRPELLSIMASAKYQGPFENVEPYYWRSRLIALLEECDGDIEKHSSLTVHALQRIDQENTTSPAYICMISGEAISSEQAAMNPDWVPSGASEAKIKEDVLDELGPLAGI
ncbi:hypothetical protein [Pseudomonas aeruginosa]|uniref:hypothetical protein n=1 Tax=Pseudomonas aeruginosa TaxID=287 RepID=UPI000448CF02|nr:hypothetical protein [Pseudomonas aeruginosa]EZP05714.1 hypothetical protein V555_01856 [Pseudomonas aeruginosa BWH054]KSH45779.1 hypothetical protein AO969_25890 [Pseudomonas aeruginosa]KSN02522.1 hypothetical protein APA82_09925 [Pseudomonas aeruginosa]MEA8424024.1 hypothetical protein [Pseudomonas aeruginosa]RQE78693.1 hypothetical protein IPC294_08175 [Pseudomonas aeruginosa]